MHWGAFPFAIEFNDDFEAMANNAINILRDKKLLDNEDRVIIVSDVNQRKNVDILEIRKIL